MFSWKKVVTALWDAAGLNVHLHHNYSVHLHAPRTRYEYDLQVPLRKMVDCRTRDLHQSLLVKLNRALVRQGKSGSGLEGTRSLRPFSHHPALEGTGTTPHAHQSTCHFREKSHYEHLPDIGNSENLTFCINTPMIAMHKLALLLQMSSVCARVCSAQLLTALIGAASCCHHG